LKQTERDEKFQLTTARLARRMNRRSFLRMTSGGIAGGVAAMVLGIKEAKPAFAHSTDICYPPGGNYCSGCGADSTCPTAYITCTPYEDWCGGLCPYWSGWWYTGTYPNRHKCRDCRVLYCPCSCYPYYHGYCGCKSTLHY